MVSEALRIEVEPMLPPRPKILAGCVLLMTAACVCADDAPVPRVGVDDVLYKGIVGKALDVMPIDPQQRVALQRASAVASGTASGRAVSTWVGWSNPFLLVGGLVWGIFAASNIRAEAKAARVEATLAPNPVPVVPPAANVATEAERTAKQPPAAVAVVVEATQ